MVDEKSPRSPEPEPTEPEVVQEEAQPQREPPETARHPAPGIEHEPEPSGENLIPAEDRPGTF